MKKQITFLFTILSILFFFSACEKDLQEETGNSANNSASALIQGVAQQNVLLDEVKNDPYLSPIFNKALKNIKTNKEVNKRSNQETTYGLNLADEVKKYTLAETEYTSYTIPILNDNGNSYFQNLVIEKDVLRDAVYLITYFPDENYKESIKQNLVHDNDNIDFTGSKMVEYLYYKRKVNVVNSPAQNRTGEAGAPAETEGIIEPNMTVCVEIYTPRECTAGGGHTPGQSCTGNSSQQPGWQITVSCTTIFPRGGSGGSNYCSGCDLTVPYEGSSSGNNPTPFFPDNNPNPDWIPKYICVATNPRTGECTEVIPYTPIITDAMDPYNYYSGILSQEHIHALLSYQYREVRQTVDAFIEAKRATGSLNTKTRNFINELVGLALAEDNFEDANALLNMTILLDKNKDRIFEDDFIMELDPYMDMDLASNPPDFWNLLGIRGYLKYRRVRELNPEWSMGTCLYHVSKDLIHLSLDAFGLIPVFGEAADLVNGALYTVEGDGLNATLSFASAVPVAGWAAAGTKFGLKVVNSTRVAYTISTKVKLVWKITKEGVEFGHPSQLRVVLGDLVKAGQQAHHIIPWAAKTIQKHPVVQRAARSGSAFHLNEALNGIAVAEWRNQPNHPKYNAKILDKLEDFIKDSPNANPDQCYNRLMVIINQAKQAIINNPNVHLNDLIF